MTKLPSSRARVLVVISVTAVIAVASIAGFLVGGGDTVQTIDLSPAASVLGASYAKSLGFSRTYVAAKKSTMTGERGCSDSVEAVYENLTDQTALISEVVNCKSAGDASASLASGRKELQVDSSMRVPKELGPGAFASATHAPEYLVAWQVGNRVAIVALDVNIAASSSGSSSTVPSKPITKSQENTLADAALQQNSLYH